MKQHHRSKLHKQIFNTSKKELIQAMIWTGIIMAAMYAGTIFIGIDTIQNKVDSLGSYGPIVFILIKALAIIFAPISGSALYFIAGPLFGFWHGFFYVAIGETLGSIVAFFVSRLLGRRILKLFLSDSGLKSVDGVLYHIGSWKGLIYARLIFVGLQDVVSYAAGLTQIPFWHFLAVTTLIATIPLIALVAAGMAFLDKTILTIAAVAVMAMAGCFLVLRWFKKALLKYIKKP